MVAPFWPRAHRSPVSRHRNRNRSNSFARSSGLLPVRQEVGGRREGSVFICILFLNICNFSSHFRFPGNEIRSSHGIHFFSLNIRMRVRRAPFACGCMERLLDALEGKGGRMFCSSFQPKTAHGLACRETGNSCFFQGDRTLLMHWECYRTGDVSVCVCGRLFCYAFSASIHPPSLLPKACVLML